MEAIAEIHRVSSRVAAHLPEVLPAGGRRTGAVLGAVQSGKTGVMGGVAALALDKGYRLVIVLSGLREDLRMQTARRLKRELLRKGDRVYNWKDGSWAASEPPAFDHPLGKGYHGQRRDCWSPHYKDDINADQAVPSEFIRALKRGDAALLVVKKNPRVLERLHAVLSDARRTLGAPQLPMLVLDDECDEASVTDLLIERPTSDSIEQLILRGEGQTAAYVGVTATIAANVLQDATHTLFPRDFVEVARYPAERETVLTFEEPDPLRRYTGGFVFYRLFDEIGQANFLVQSRIGDAEQAATPASNEALSNALIAYFVSAAMRLPPGCSFVGEGKRPPPHTMMLHTDGRVDSHRALAQRVLEVVAAHAGPGTLPPRSLPRDPTRRFSGPQLMSWLGQDPGAWRSCFESFAESRQVLDVAVPGAQRRPMPGWEEVAARLPTVFENVKLRIVNSDDSLDEPPLDFGAPGSAANPYDVYSVIIGGNRLSRGLTIEGLTTSYYTRMSAGTVTEDTTVQRERWFGFRGSHLEYCRVFVHPATARMLESFHEHDVDLRRQFAWMVKEGRGPSDTAVRMRCLPTSRPTARQGRGESINVSFAGTRVFLPYVEMGEEEEALAIARHNEALAAEWWRRLRAGGRRVGPAEHPRGYLLTGLQTEDILALLESLRFRSHNPDPHRRVSTALSSYHRTQASERPEGQWIPFESCPYAMAAYLRYWTHAFASYESGDATVGHRGEDGVSRWVATAPPRFNVGFRFGDMDEEAGGLFSGARLLDRAIVSPGVVASRWGGHGTAEGNFGDEWFDVDPPSGDPSEPRPEGLPGLVLVHVGHKEGRGRGQLGLTYQFHRPFLGLCIPRGGPSFQAVIAPPAKP
ncbi:MAG: Z1 domain-containing protein [Longimicrobiales bacterium]